MRLVERLAELLAPERIVGRVTDISPAGLLADGIRGLIVDLDNTLTEWQSEVIPDDVLRWLEALKGGGVSVCLASNTHNRRRLERVASKLGVPYVQGLPKPRKRCFNRALELLGLTADSVAVVGDQLFTDILGAGDQGFTRSWCALHHREFIGTKISRLASGGCSTGSSTTFCPENREDYANSTAAAAARYYFRAVRGRCAA